MKRGFRLCWIFIIIVIAAGMMWYYQNGNWRTEKRTGVYIIKPQGETLWVVNGEEKEAYLVKGKVTEATYEGMADLEICGNVVRKIICKPVNDSSKITEEKEQVQEKIRVLLTTTGFADKEHEEVRISSDQEYSVVGETEENHQAGEEITIRPQEMKTEKILVKAKNNGKLQISSISRNGRVPSYRGTLELKRVDGKIRMVNELTMEEYLYGVLPSEMPPEYPEAALRAQAICARSYAQKQKKNSRLQEYDAHVDDSVAYQVYQSQPEDDRANKAVDDTKGMVACIGDAIASTYFFATSCGVTTSAYSTFFSNQEVSYLVGQVQSSLSEDKKKVERDRLAAETYENESLFREFLETEKEVLEKEEPWYRWSTTISLEDMERQINDNIAERCAKTPQRIQVREGDGSYHSKQIDSIGKLKRVVIKKRGSGGVARMAVIVGTKATVRVWSEYNIRKLLFSDSARVRRGDGKEATTLTMLPSGFFVLNPVGNSYEIKGGGYGHGVGMSQTGARQLALQGKDEKEIMNYYFPNVSILSMSQVET